METSNFRPALHVAQQSRREKLRVQNHSNPTQNAEVYAGHLENPFSGHAGGNPNPDLVQLRSTYRYGNLSYEPVVFPSEVINFAASNSHSMMLHQDSINSSAKVVMSTGGDPQNCSAWKSIGSQESCENWIVGNYNTSGTASGIDGNPNPIFVGQGLSASLKSNNSHPPSSYGTYHLEARSSLTSQPPPPSEISSRNVNYNSPSLYHNHPLVPHEIGFAAIPGQHNSHREALSTVSWPINGGNELVLLPAYVDHRGENACDAIISRQVDDDHPRITGNDIGSNTQALSLSLSSIPLCKSHVCAERMVPENAGCFGNDLNQDVKTTLKSEYLCFDTKATYNGGKGVESDHQHVGVVGSSSLLVSNNRSVGPLGPFTGYATILKSSRFLKPAQLLLDEFCNVVGPKPVKIVESPEKLTHEVRAPCDDINAGESIGGGGGPIGGDSGGSSSTFYSSNNNYNEKTQAVGGLSSSTESYRPEFLQTKAKLLYMLEEVCRRYKHYNQQMQMVVSAFETVAGLSAATPYISQALRSVLRHFRCLKSAISDQLKNVRKALGEDLLCPTAGTGSSNKGDAGSMTSSRLKLMDQTLQKQKGSNVGFFETQQHVWRPQRGLPERAVAILRAWLFDHFLHPYPTDADKHMLATQTGLSRNQVSNWFINARVRVWKPMVEEIHMLETKGSAETGSILGKTDAKTNESVGLSNDIQTSNRLNSGGFTVKPVPECSEIGSSGFVRSRMNVDEWNQKRSRVDCHVPAGTMDGSHSQLVGFVPYGQNGIDIGSLGLGAVSLTLGLRRNGDGGGGGAQPLQPPQQENQIRRHFGDQIIYDFVG